MALSISEYLIKGAQTINGKVVSKKFQNKLNIIGTRYSSLEGFKHADIETFNSFKTQEGEICFNKLSLNEVDIIKGIQNGIVVNKSLQENFIITLTRHFVNKQLTMIDSINIEEFNINPILCHALQLKTSNDFIKYNAYQAISRSIVTSMGFLVQDLLLYSNENVADGKTYEEGRNTKWDLVVESLEGMKSFLEIKSGFNDMDAAQIKHYNEEIKLIEAQHNKGFIGITYGKREAQTVTAGLLKTYMDEWENKTLIGKELWEYITGEENYHIRLLKVIDETVKALLHNDSIISKIDKKIKELKTTFDKQYPNVYDYYNTLW